MGDYEADYTARTEAVVGSVLMVHAFGAGVRRQYRQIRVARVTATQLVDTEGGRWLKSTGYRVGNNDAVTHRYQSVGACDDRKVRESEQAQAQALADAHEKIKRTKWSELDIAALEQVLALVDRLRGTNNTDIN